MKRFILSILAGLFTTAILSIATDHIFHISNIYPPYGEPMMDDGLLLIAFSYRAVFAIMGAYITAAIAKEKAMKAVIVLGIIGSLLWLLGALLMWDFATPWYNIGGVITGVPFTWIGGKLYEKQKQNSFTK